MGFAGKVLPEAISEVLTKIKGLLATFAHGVVNKKQTSAATMMEPSGSAKIGLGRLGG